MIQAQFQLTLTLQAPVLSHAAGTVSLGVDAAMQRYRGQPAFNGSQIRGNLRHQLEHFRDELTLAGCPITSTDEYPDILTAGQIRDLFGPPGHTDTENLKAALSFDFYWTPTAVRPEPDSGADVPPRYRIEIDDDGVVALGSLQVIESPYPTGTEIDFSGRIRLHLSDAQIDYNFDGDDDEDVLAHCEQWLSKAVDLLPAVGALKGAGFGRILGARLERIGSIRTALPSSPPADGPDRIGILLHLDRPFSIGLDATHQPDDNRYLHGTQIPGSVIKAVIARAFDGAREVFRPDLWFDDLVVTTALPALREAPERRIPLPLSLVLARGSNQRYLVRDLALQPEPCLFKLGNDLVAPAFLPDWKDSDLDLLEQQAFGRKRLEVPALLSVRTSIRRGPNVADEGRLFVLECADHLEHVWCADIDLAQIREEYRAPARGHLLSLLDAGLDGIGKTHARARVEVRNEPFTPVPLSLAVSPVIPVLLRTPARLLPDDLELPGTNGDGDLRKRYRDYWREVSGGRLRLSHYFAQQEPVGGGYYQARYRPTKPYRPAWLTVSGSLFALEPVPGKDPDEIVADLTDWARFGLPPTGGVTAGDWERTPFLRENGFGEVLIDDALHRRLAPGSSETWLFGDAP